MNTSLTGRFVHGPAGDARLSHCAARPYRE